MSNRMIYSEKDYNEYFKKYNVEPRIISDGDEFDPNYGTDYALLTDEDIKALQEGKALYININGIDGREYCCLLKKEINQKQQESILDKIRDEVLEYIDDLDIAAEICDIFNKY